LPSGGDVDVENLSFLELRSTAKKSQLDYPALSRVELLHHFQLTANRDQAQRGPL